MASTTSSTTPSCCTKGSECDLLTWKDPIKTGKLFGSIIIGLTIFKTINLINVLFHFGYIALLIVAAAEYSTKLITGNGIISKYKPTCSCAEKFNQSILPHLSIISVKLESQFKKVIFAEDVECTLKAAGVFYIFYKLTSWFSIFTLVTTATVLLFTLPFIYTTYKKEIDAAVANFSACAKSKISEVTSTIQETAKPHIETLIKKTGPVGEFIQSKIHTRTAGSTVKDSKDSVFATATGGAAAAAAKPKSSEPADVFSDLKSSATATGSSQFPNIPSSSTSEVRSKVEDVEDETEKLL